MFSQANVSFFYGHEGYENRRIGRVYRRLIVETEQPQNIKELKQEIVA